MASFSARFGDRHDRIDKSPRTSRRLKQSRVGKRPIPLPKGVTAVLKDGGIDVKGPKGALSRKLPPNVKVTLEGAVIKVMPTIGGRDGSRFQGLARALINGMVQGTASGYTKTLQLVGTGYRAEVKGQMLGVLARLLAPRRTSPFPRASPSPSPATRRERSSS